MTRGKAASSRRHALDLVALAALTAIFSIYLSSSTRALRLEDETVRPRRLISAGIELTAYRLLLGKDDERPAQGAFRLRLGDDELEVSFLTEASRIDLNGAPKDMIANFFTVLGAKGDAAQEYAERVVAWRKKPSGNVGRNPKRRCMRPPGEVIRLGLRRSSTPMNSRSYSARLRPGRPRLAVRDGVQRSGRRRRAHRCALVAALPGMTPLS